MSAPRSLFLYQVARSVDDQCLQQLFSGHVEKCVFGGWGLGRFALVDFSDAEFRNMVLSQAIGGVLLDKALNPDSMRRALLRNKHHTISESSPRAKRRGSAPAQADEMSLVDFVVSNMIREQEESEVDRISSIVSSSVLASMRSAVVASPTTKRGSFVHPDGKAVGGRLQSDTNATITATLLRMLPSEADRTAIVPTLGPFSMVVIGQCRLGITGSEISVHEMESAYSAGLKCSFAGIANTGLLSTLLSGPLADRPETETRERDFSRVVVPHTKRAREEPFTQPHAAEHHITFEEPKAKAPKKAASDDDEAEEPVALPTKKAVVKSTGPVDFSSDDEDDSLFAANNNEHNPRFTTNAGAKIVSRNADAPANTKTLIKTEAPAESALNNRQRKQQAKAENKPSKVSLADSDDD